MRRLAKRTENPIYQTQFRRLRNLVQTKLRDESNEYNYNYQKQK